MSPTGFYSVVITRKRIVAALAFILALVIVWIGVGHWRTRSVSAPPGASPTVPMDRPVREVKGATGRIALTINVDWGNEDLLQMLDLFDEHNVKATFFLTGRWATSFPEIAREIAARGHEVGNHGLRHDHPTQISAAALHEMIAGGIRAIEEATGVRPVPLFAPPYGEQDERVVRTAATLGLWTTLWTYDTIDWQEPPPHVIIDRIVPRASDGGIVLMHPKPQTVQALPEMIRALRQKGLEPTPLWEMMQAVPGGDIPKVANVSKVSALASIGAGRFGFAAAHGVGERHPRRHRVDTVRPVGGGGILVSGRLPR